MANNNKITWVPWREHSADNGSLGGKVQRPIGGVGGLSYQQFKMILFWGKLFFTSNLCFRVAQNYKKKNLQKLTNAPQPKNSV